MELMARNDYTGTSEIPEKYLGDFASMNEAIHVMNEDMNHPMAPGRIVNIINGQTL